MNREICPKKRGRYCNPHLSPDPTISGGKFWKALLWKMGWLKEKRSISQELEQEQTPLPLLHKDKPFVRWLNHDTFLVSYQGIHLLTDPIWSHRCSPLRFLGPSRLHPPGLELEALPPIDIVVISHNHYDHLDHKTVMRLFSLFPEIVWIVPQGMKKWFLKRGIKHVFELAWWEQSLLSRKLAIKITAVPAQHWSGRTLWDTNRSLWAGWVVEFGPHKTLYFAGDTGYNPFQFKEIGKRWRKIDLSLIPIGCYYPRKFMSSVHVNPEEAVKIHQDVKSALTIGMHWKTFRLGDELPHEPAVDLLVALKQAGLDPESFKILEPGSAINW